MKLYSEDDGVIESIEFRLMLNLRVEVGDRML